MQDTDRIITKTKICYITERLKNHSTATTSAYLSQFHVNLRNDTTALREPWRPKTSTLGRRSTKLDKQKCDRRRTMVAWEEESQRRSSSGDVVPRSERRPVDPKSGSSDDRAAEVGRERRRTGDAKQSKRNPRSWQHAALFPTSPQWCHFCPVDEMSSSSSG